MVFSQKKITQIGNETIESLEPSPTETLQPLDQWPKAVEAPLTMTMAVPGPEKSEGSSQRMSWLGLGAWSSSNHSSLSLCFFWSVESCFAIYSASDSYPIHRLARAALLPFFWPQGKVTSDFRLSSLANGHPWPAGLLPRLEWLAGRKWRPQEKQWPKKDVQQIGKMPLDPMWIVMLIIPNWKVPYKRITLVLLLLSLLLFTFTVTASVTITYYYQHDQGPERRAWRILAFTLTSFPGKIREVEVSLSKVKRKVLRELRLFNVHRHFIDTNQHHIRFHV